ncbi:MAG: TIGR04086 family membrane protein [Firmicutes bacterium]|nr:TIGR04086 family membrane protein [Bacillota bacterium]
MEFIEEKFRLPIGPIIYGCLVTFFCLLCVTIVIAIAVESGWTVTIAPYQRNLFLGLGYLALITGSITGGLKSNFHGWLVGLGIGLGVSLIFLILETVSGAGAPHWGIYLVKTLISAFIGLFGGIIGVNISSSRKSI